MILRPFQGVWEWASPAGITATPPKPTRSDQGFQNVLRKIPAGLVMEVSKFAACFSVLFFGAT